MRIAGQAGDQMIGTTAVSYFFAIRVQIGQQTGDLGRGHGSTVHEADLIARQGCQNILGRQQLQVKKDK